MQKRILLFSLLILAFHNIGFAALIEKNAPVAVMDFGTHPGAATSDVALVNAELASSEFIINRIVANGKMVVVDKDMVRNRLNDAGIKVVGLIDPQSAKIIGDLLNVKYIIYGNVNDITASETGTKILGPIGGGVSVYTVNAHVIARIMDINSGNIIAASKGMGSSKSSFSEVNTPQIGIKIGTVTVTQDSVHNALQKAAYDAMDIMQARLFDNTGKKGNKV